MKILITEPDYFPKDLVKPLEKIGDVVAKKVDYNQLLEEIKDTDILFIRVQTKVDKKILDNAEKLKAIASMTTGLDHIDIKQAEVRGIKIISPPGYATTATAEYTMSLVMALSRKIPWAFEHFKKEKWERHRFLGTELQGKTIGVIGFGRIGSRVGKFASAFGMKVIFYDPYLDSNMLKDVQATRVDSLDELIKTSDVITIHAFLSKDTKKMMSKEQLSKMKRSAIIVNAARGMELDESDLVEALESGKIAGAALDVFEEEPLPPSHELVNYARTHDNLLLTPHIAGSTKESIDLAARLVVEKIQEEFGKKL